ncbi:MAG: DUF4397 domain-containing protein [Kineosporiaceae bacterium]|nr:DUF4397 domain-containing protein [Kineosporiaceae bacterium]MBK8077163.1 DUF4397 domain-containing protein [Kineosporiaceae bacterium]
MGVRWARGLLSVLALALASTAALFAVPMSAGAASTGDVFVVHGLVGSPADVVVDGHTVAAAAAPKTIVGPLHLAAGPHVLTLKNAGTSVVTGSFTVKAGESIDVVAHRSADAARSAVITVFGNDLRAIAPGKSRLVVSHVAAAPPVDIRDNGKVIFRNVANGESLTVENKAMDCLIDMVPTATSGPVILDPVTVTLQPGTLVRLYAIGDATAGTTDAVLHVMRLGLVGSKRPGVVRTGDGGQAADTVIGGTSPATWALLAAFTAFAGLVLLNRRSTAGPVIGSRHSR